MADSSPSLVRLKDAPAAGIPFTAKALEWLSFWRDDNGAASSGAIVKVGGRLFVDPAQFTKWMRTNPIISPPGIRRQGKTKVRTDSAS
jgi:hypothetical protein